MSEQALIRPATVAAAASYAKRCERYQDLKCKVDRIINVASGNGEIYDIIYLNGDEYCLARDFGLIEHLVKLGYKASMRGPDGETALPVTVDPGPMIVANLIVRWSHTPIPDPCK